LVNAALEPRLMRRENDNMLTDAFIDRHRQFLHLHGHPSGPRGIAEYRRFMKAGTKGSPGAYDAALPRSASRSTDYLPRPVMVAGDRSLPGFQMLPVRTWQGSTDFYLGGAGPRMARDENGEARTELAAWARENMSPEECAKLEELIDAILADHEAERERREQPRLTKHLQRKHGLSDGEVERVRDLIIGRDQSGRAPPFGEHDTPLFKQQGGSAMALDPPVSERQSRAMHAAAEGRSTLGIPQSVGKEFVGEDDWVGSAERPAPRRAPPLEEPEDDEATKRIKNYLSLFSHLLTPADIEHALQLTAAARKRQPKSSSGSMVGDAARRRNSNREVRSFAERFPGAPEPFAPVSTTRVFV
jgi:hypothetical protein